VGRKQKPRRNAVWTRELGSVLMEGIGDNPRGCTLAQDRLKLIHPLPPGSKRYPTEFQRWLKKVFEGRPVAGERVWLTGAFWQNEVDRALVDAIFRNTSTDEVIARICATWPKLSAIWLNERLEEVALTGLPRWMDKEFWPNEVDPILLVGIRNSKQCECQAVATATKEWPDWGAAATWYRLRRLRRQKTEGLSTSASDLRGSVTSEPTPCVNPGSTLDRNCGPDPILLAGIREGRRHERESVNRVLRKFPDLRVGSIWTRLRRLREQQREQAQIGVPFEWTTDLDEHLRRIHTEAGLRAAVSEVQCITGWPRNAILRRARKLGLPSQPVGSRRRWRMAEFRFALESVNHMSVKEIAEEIGRSEKAVREMVAQRGIEGRFQDGYSLRELAEKLHVRRTRVRNWVKSGLLRPKKNGRIDETSVQSFLYSHPENIRWSLLDEDTASWISQLVDTERTRSKVPAMRTVAKHQRLAEAKEERQPTHDGTVSNTHEADPSEDHASIDSQAHGASPLL
jgi:hypothetical protein